MLGRRPDPGLFTAANQLDLGSLGVYGLFAREGRQLFNDYEFRGLYSRIGRPSAPPALMALACLLQHLEGISDEQVIDRLRFDLRWKAALDLDPLDTRAPFSKAAYQSWRARLLLHKKEGVAFERMIRRATREGLLPKRLTIALDSSPVRGRGAVKDTFNLISDGVRAAVRDIATSQGTAPSEIAAELGVERHFSATSVKGSELVNWDDEEEKAAFLTKLVEEAQRVVAEAEKRGCESEAAALLSKIIEQDVEQKDDKAEIRDGVARDRTVSVSDPEQRHGHKSSGKSYTGHKAHVAVETTTELVLAVDVTSPSGSDGLQTAALIKETERTTEREVEVVLGDSAYSSREALEQAAQAEVAMHTKMPGPRKGCFGPGDFKVSPDRETAVCPAGHEATKKVRTKDLVVHHWSHEQCSTCPFRGQCIRTGSKSGKRSLAVKPDFHARRAREAWAKTPEGRAILRQRVAAEHAIGRAKNRGAGRSRYFGRRKTRFQWLWVMAINNYLRICALLERREELAAVGAAA